MRSLRTKLLMVVLVMILVVGGTMGCEVKNTKEPCVINMPDELDSETDLMIKQYAIEYWQKNPNTAREGLFLLENHVTLRGAMITEYYKAASGAVIIGFDLEYTPLPGAYIIPEYRFRIIDKELGMTYACWVYVWYNGFIYTNIKGNSIRNAYDDRILVEDDIRKFNDRYDINWPLSNMK